MLVFLLTFAHAADEDPKEPWFEQSVHDFGPFGVRIRDAYLGKNEGMTKLSFVNQSDSFIEIDMTKTTFVLGGGVEQTDERTVLVRPRDTKGLNVEHKAKGIRTLTPKIRFAGVRFAEPIPHEVEPVELRDGTIDVGGIVCKQEKRIDQTAKFTDVTYRCENNGTNVGVIRPDTLKLVATDGSTFGNLGDAASRLIEPGKAYVFDARFEPRRPLLDANGKEGGDRLLATITLDFSAAVTEARWTGLEVPEIALTYDPDRTANH